MLEESALVRDVFGGESAHTAVWNTLQTANGRPNLRHLETRDLFQVQTKQGIRILGTTLNSFSVRAVAAPRQQLLQ